ncbi:MAG: YraN family protein [Actinobacteria bacterium]|nr:YraN family protein [Actinomycetota bacterium]
MRVKDAVGRYGEQLAADLLVEEGLTLLARNWRCRAGELDIVALDGDQLVIVEVKTRSSTGYGLPAEAVDRAKARRLRELALRWMIAERERAGGGTVWARVRFDVVSVVRRTPDGPRVTHLRGVL